jgi:transcriptional regulator with XRE-family HTH domain
MTIGDYVRSRRRELDITQQELADRMGVSRDYIQSVESGGTQMPSWERLKLFVRGLETTHYALFTAVEGIEEEAAAFTTDPDLQRIHRAVLSWPEGPERARRKALLAELAEGLGGSPPKA